MKKRYVVALIVTAVLLWLIFRELNWTELVATFKEFNPCNLLTIAVLYVFGLYIRGIRWKALLLNNPKYKTLHLAEIFTVGGMLNSFLPMRAGDAYRAYYLGHIQHESKLKVFGSIILERTLDGIYVFLMLLAATLLYCKQPWVLKMTCAVGALFVGALLTAFIVYKFRNKLPLPDFLNKFTNGFEALENKTCFAIANIATFAIWTIECFVAYLILKSFGLGLGLAAGLFVISFIAFSSMIPSMSVYVGPYQGAYILALGIFGVDKAAALAVSAVHQAIFMILLAVIGVYCILKFNISIKNLKY